jgi:hypothetical protein
MSCDGLRGPQHPDPVFFAQRRWFFKSLRFYAIPSLGESFFSPVKSLSASQLLRPRLNASTAGCVPELFVERRQSDGSPKRLVKQHGRSELNRVVTPEAVLPRECLGARNQRLRDRNSGDVRPLRGEGSLRSSRASSSRRLAHTAFASAAATSARLTTDVATTSTRAANSMASRDPRSSTCRFTNALASKYAITRGSR